MRAFDRDLIRGGHYGQRSCEPHSKAEHMAAPTNAANVKKALANPEPSTHGPSPHLAAARQFGRFRRESDIERFSTRTDLMAHGADVHRLTIASPVKWRLMH